MNKWLRLVVSTALLLSATISQADTRTGLVTYVADGDTFKAQVNGQEERVRLSAIDAPELDQPYGLASKQTLQSLINGRTLTLEVSGRDKWGRLIADVSFNDASINAVMVQRGMAWEWPRYNDSERLRALHRHARREQVGLWQQPAPIPPWEWRYRN